MNIGQSDYFILFLFSPVLLKFTADLLLPVAILNYWPITGNLHFSIELTNQMAVFHPPYWIIDQSQISCPPIPPPMVQNSHFSTTDNHKIIFYVVHHENGLSWCFAETPWNQALTVFLEHRASSISWCTAVEHREIRLTWCMLSSKMAAYLINIRLSCLPECDQVSESTKTP